MVALAVILPSLLLLIAGSIYLIKKLQLEKKILSMQKEAENEEKEIAHKELEKEREEKEKELQTKGKRVGGQFTAIKDTTRTAKSLGNREGMNKSSSKGLELSHPSNESLRPDFLPLCKCCIHSPALCC